MDQPVQVGHYFDVGVYDACDAAQRLQPQDWYVRAAIFGRHEEHDLETQGGIRVGSVKVRTGDPTRGLYAVPRMVAATDIARIADVTPDTVQQWAKRHPDFRALAQKTSAGLVWRHHDAIVWLRSTGRLK